MLIFGKGRILLNILNWVLDNEKLEPGNWTVAFVQGFKFKVENLY
jgi:hypothetical protein